MDVIKIMQSNDDICRKYIQKTNDEYRIETTYVDYSNKNIICFSTQVGCNMGCQFCYNGIRKNFVRNLTYEEMVSQIENVIQNENINNNKLLLFSAMGIGEPLLNYKNLIKVFHYLNNKYQNSKFALATCGVNQNNILRLAEDLKNLNFKLTISLHSANPIKRKEIMPINVNLISFVELVKKYKDMSGKKVEWNYVLLDGVNDSNEDAKKLFELLGKNEHIKINKYNKVDNCHLIGSKRVNEFILELQKYGMQVEYYETNGYDVNGACGQLVSGNLNGLL